MEILETLNIEQLGISAIFIIYVLLENARGRAREAEERQRTLESEARERRITDLYREDAARMTTTMEKLESAVVTLRDVLK